MYVSEFGYNRISIFDVNGTFLHSFGKRKGQSTEACGTCITVDTLSNLYVCDTSNNRIVVYKCFCDNEQFLFC